jgi:chromosome segregation ATPase
MNLLAVSIQIIMLSLSFKVHLIRIACSAYCIDSELIAKLTGRLRALEKDMVAKNKSIKASSALINDLKNKNGDYARELSILSQTVDELVDSKRESIGKISELEMDIAVKNESVKQLADEVVEHQKIIKNKDNKIAALAKDINIIETQKHGLETRIEELQARNDDYASEFENLLSSLKDLVDQNAVLEFHVKELQGKNTALTETVSGLTSSLEDVKNKYQKEVCANEILRSENDEIKSSVLRMMDDHKHTIGYWENQLQCEPTIE